MSLIQFGPVLAGGLFVGVLAFLELGRRNGRRRIASVGPEAGFGAVESAIFGLMGLLIAFTFSGAAGRFDGRRDLVRQEANAIGTAWLRIDLVPVDAQVKLRDLFRRYLDSRLGTYRNAGQMERAMAEFARSEALQKDIWTLAVAACRDPGAAPGAPMLLLPALNEMIDIRRRGSWRPVSAKSRDARRLTPGGVAGRARWPASARWSWMSSHTVMAATVYIIIDPNTRGSAVAGSGGPGAVNLRMD